VEAAALPTPANASTSKEVVYENPTHRFFPEFEDDDDDDVENKHFTEEDVQAFGRENVGTVAGLYVVSYFYNKLFLDTQFVFEKLAIRL